MRATGHEEIVQKIRIFARAAQEASQVAKRLRKLLPTRLEQLYRNGSAERRGGRAMREALTDQRYKAHVEELVAMTAEARTARIQYETHLMLVEARRSMRALIR